MHVCLIGSMVISLGDAPLAQADWKAVAVVVAARLYGQPPLLPVALGPAAQPWVDSNYPAGDAGRPLVALATGGQRPAGPVSGRGVGGPGHPQPERGARTGVSGLPRLGSPGLAGRRENGGDSVVPKKVQI